MRVLFDHQVFSWQQYGGISRYIVEVAKGINALGHESIFPDGFFSENVYLDGLPDIHAIPLTTFDFKGKKWLQERLGRVASLKSLRQSKATVFHPTYFGDYFLKTVLHTKTPFVVTIHDMIHEKYGHGSRGFFSLDANVVAHKRLLAQQASAVIVVSEHTRQDVLQYIPEVDPAKLHLIHHGNSLRAPSPEQPHRLNLPDRYLLFVGQRGAYKNFAWMLDQLATLIHEEPNLHLVCVGGAGFDAAELAQIASLKMTGKISQPRISCDADLSELYARAQCFLFPSKYEGFGFPVLEAFACGCPAILNAVSSLPEVGGNAASYFDDGDGAGLQAAVKKMLQDASARKALIQKGLDRAQQFTWQKSAALHLQVYQSVTESA